MNSFDAVVLPDIHAPKHDERCVDAVIKFIKEVKPKYVIQLGDLCDFNSLSRFDVLREDELIGFGDEVKSATRIIDRIEEASGGRKVFIEGNHDQRVETYRLNSWDKNLRKFWGKDLTDCFTLFDFKRRGWETRRYGEFYELGKCLYSHGWFVGTHHAKKTVQRFFRTVIYGHTHQWQVHTVVGLDQRPVAGISLGTLSRFDLSYLRGVPPDWVHMFGYIEYWGNGNFTPHCIPIIDGHFKFNGQLF